MDIQKIRYEVVTGRGKVLSAHRIQRCAFLNRERKGWHPSPLTVRKVAFDHHGNRYILRNY